MSGSVEEALKKFFPHASTALVENVERQLREMGVKSADDMSSLTPAQLNQLPMGVRHVFQRLQAYFSQGCSLDDQNDLASEGERGLVLVGKESTWPKITIEKKEFYFYVYAFPEDFAEKKQMKANVVTSKSEDMFIVGGAKQNKEKNTILISGVNLDIDKYNEAKAMFKEALVLWEKKTKIKFFSWQEYQAIYKQETSKKQDIGNTPQLLFPVHSEYLTSFYPTKVVYMGVGEQSHSGRIGVLKIGTKNTSELNNLIEILKFNSSESIKFQNESLKKLKETVFPLYLAIMDKEWYDKDSKTRKGSVESVLAKRTCLHETGHWIGLLHEHERQDAKDIVDTQNLKTADKVIYSIKSKSVGDFDYYSVMLYNKKQGLSFKKLPKNVSADDLIRDEPSDGDYASVNLIYK